MTSVTFIKSLLALVFTVLLFIYIVHDLSENNTNTQIYLNAPQVDDIYFLDARLMTDNLRPKEKYRLAKVVDVTGDIVTLLYGNVFYLRQQALKDSIRYGQLRYQQYFESKRYDLSLSQLQVMLDTSAIFMVKRPKNNMLYGNYVNDPKPAVSRSIFIPGKRENSQGLSLLKSANLEGNLQQAYRYFLMSATLGFAEGQINLGQMYLNGDHVEKNLVQALFWLNKAALQSNKAAVLKYVIVCRQLDTCQEVDFYQRLFDAGVNIKVRSIDFELD